MKTCVLSSSFGAFNILIFSENCNSLQTPLGMFRLLAKIPRGIRVNVLRFSSCNVLQFVTCQEFIILRSVMVGYKSSVIYILGAPEITVAPDDQKVVENGIASFFCQATGNPQPEIYWRKGGRRIAGSRPRYLIVTTPDGGASVLRIDPVKSRKDDGQLECYADNGIGGGYAAQAKLEVYPSQQDGEQRKGNYLNLFNIICHHLNYPCVFGCFWYLHGVSTECTCSNKGTWSTYPVVTWSAFEEHSWDTWVCCPYANQVDYVANLSIMI